MTTTKTTKATTAPASEPAPAEITADQLADLRDTQQLSWAKVAEALTLGSPGAARRAYTNLVRLHTESVLPGRAKANGLTPVDLAGANLVTVQEAIVGRTIVVQRKDRTENIAVAKVTSLKNSTVNFNDGNKSRSVKAEAIIAVK